MADKTQKESVEKFSRDSAHSVHLLTRAALDVSNDVARISDANWTQDLLSAAVLHEYNSRYGNIFNHARSLMDKYKK